MWFPTDKLVLLEAQVHGYYAALRIRGLVEHVPSMQQGHFGIWLRCIQGWSLSQGWAYAVTQNAGAESPADVFFSLWHEYRQLTASTVGVVHLGSGHLPRGKRGVTGSQERLTRPDAIELRTYNGTGLHHFRWHVGQRQEDSWVLMDTTGNHRTSIDYAKTSAYEEFGIEPGCWSDMSS